MLDNNKIRDRSVFVTLSKVKFIREVSLAYNFLDGIPEYACGEGCFRILEYLNLSFNYIAREEDIWAIPTLLRLETLILYGNPLLGPTGEDQLQIYIEDFVKECEDVRADKGDTVKPLEVRFSFCSHDDMGVGFFRPQAL